MSLQVRACWGQIEPAAGLLDGNLYCNMQLVGAGSTMMLGARPRGGANLTRHPGVTLTPRQACDDLTKGLHTEPRGARPGRSRAGLRDHHLPHMPRSARSY